MRGERHATLGHLATLPGAQPLLYARSFTAECWVKLHTAGGSQTLLSNTGPHGNNTGLYLGLREGKLKLGFGNWMSYKASWSPGGDQGGWSCPPLQLSLELRRLGARAPMGPHRICRVG